MASAAIASATSVVTQVLSLTADVTQIGALSGLVANIPITALLVGHCLAVAGLSKGSKGIFGFIQAFLLACGGGIASNAFLGRPTANVLFASNEFIAIFAACWWVVNHNPLDIVKQALNLAPVGILARASLQILRAKLVATQVDAAAKAFPGVIAVALVAGALAGAGGKLLTDALSSVSGFRAGSELASPTYVLRSALVGASVYYTTTHVLGALSAAQGHGLLLLAFVGHSLADDLMGSTYDWTAPLFEAFAVATLQKPLPRMTRGRSSRASGSTTPRAGSRGRTPSRRTRKSD